jgi:hypothetical protein
MLKAARFRHRKHNYQMYVYLRLCSFWRVFGCRISVLNGCWCSMICQSHDPILFHWFFCEQLFFHPREISLVRSFGTSPEVTSCLPVLVFYLLLLDLLIFCHKQPVSLQKDEMCVRKRILMHESWTNQELVPQNRNPHSWKWVVTVNQVKTWMLILLLTRIWLLGHEYFFDSCILLTVRDTMYLEYLC